VSPTPTEPGRLLSIHPSESRPRNNHVEWSNSPRYTNAGSSPRLTQQFRGARTVEYRHQDPGIESPNTNSFGLPPQPAPEPQWDPTEFVDLIANRWKLQPADRKELHEFAKASPRAATRRPNKSPDDISDWPKHAKRPLRATSLYFCVSARYTAATHCALGADQRRKKIFH
jgi:hypothetical protein